MRVAKVEGGTTELITIVNRESHGFKCGYKEMKHFVVVSGKIGKILISGNQTFERPMTITDSLSLV